MSKAFIRALFGEYGKDYPQHRGNLDIEINAIVKNKYTEHFVTYVMGVSNYEALQDKGLDCVLIDDRPMVLKESFVNKIVCLKAAMEDYDEIVFLDWDCVPVKKLPDNFWNIMVSKESIQCPLYRCTRRVNTWRTGRIQPKILSGGFFVYVRDKNIPSTLLEWYDEPVNLPNKWTDETYYSKYIDNMMGGCDDGKGKFKYDEYMERFDPMVCNSRRSSFKNIMTDYCFYHPKKSKG